MTHENTNTPNQDPDEAESASREEYKDAFNAVELESKLNGQQTYRDEVTVSGEEWVNGVRVPYTNEQPVIDLMEISAQELLGRVPAKEHASLSVIGITPEDADRQSVVVSFSPDCFVKGESEEAIFQPASAIVAVTTEYPNGGSLFTSLQVAYDRRSEAEPYTGSFEQIGDMGAEDVPVAEGEDNAFDHKAFGKLFGFEMEFAPAEKDKDAKVRSYTELTRREVEGGMVSATDNRDESEITRKLLTSAEAEAMRVVAHYYSSSPDEGGQ